MHLHGEHTRFTQYFFVLVVVWAGGEVQQDLITTGDEGWSSHGVAAAAYRLLNFLLQPLQKTVPCEVSPLMLQKHWEDLKNLHCPMSHHYSHFRFPSLLMPPPKFG